MFAVRPFMTQKSQPFYHKATLILFGLILFTYVLYLLQGTLIPIAFALVLAILVNPVYNWLRNRKVPKLLAVSLSLLLLVLLFALLTYFLSSQFSHFTQSLPALKQKMNDIGAQLGQWLQNNAGIDAKKQADLLNEAMEKGRSLAGSTIGSIFGTLGSITLLPVYIFLFLYYKTLFLEFLFDVFAEKNAAQVGEILNEVKAATQSYMVGLLLEALIVAVLNSIALLILGVKYAVLFGVIGALLNMIPYIGGLVAIALPVLMATVTKDGFGTQLWIVVSYLVIQFIDNNILVPNVVSSKVSLNAFISVVIVLLGGALWGISGMFLSIPFTGILKIIFDRVPDLKPWGKLLGDAVPLHHKGERWRLRKRRSKPKALSEKNYGRKIVNLFDYCVSGNAALSRLPCCTSAVLLSASPSYSSVRLT